MFYDDFRYDPKIIWKSIKKVLFHWSSPIVIGLANLIFAQGLAGYTLGIVFILIGIEEYIDRKDK
jgi:hypothetical protein